MSEQPEFDRVEALDVRAPLAESTEAIVAALAQVEDLAWLRYLRHHASRVSNYTAVIQLVEEIPPEVRSAEDDIDHGYALCCLGRFAEAERFFAAMDPGELNLIERMMHLLNWALVILWQERELPRDRLATLVGMLEQSRELAAGKLLRRELGRDQCKLYVGTAESGLALCAARQGDLVEAAELATSGCDKDPTNPWTHAAMATVSSGGRALEAWKACLERAHPESHLGRLASTKLGGVYR